MMFMDQVHTFEVESKVMDYFVNIQIILGLQNKTRQKNNRKPVLPLTNHIGSVCFADKYQYYQCCSFRMDTCSNIELRKQWT